MAKLYRLNSIQTIWWQRRGPYTAYLASEEDLICCELRIVLLEIADQFLDGITYVFEGIVKRVHAFAFYLTSMNGRIVVRD